MKIRTYQPSDCKSLADLFYHLADATEVDKQVLQKQYHIAKIIDLRTETERKEKPDVFIPNAEYQFIPIFDESMACLLYTSEKLMEIP